MKDESGPAFPDPAPCENGAQGMSLRDYFAAAALQGMLANSVEIGLLIDKHGTKDNAAITAIAHGVYVIASAMLKAREQ